MFRVNIAEAKARFSEILERAQLGESIEICKRNQPLAILGPVAKQGKRVFGQHAGMIHECKGAWGPMADEELREWEPD